MAFQSQVYVEQALGKAGTISRLNPITKEPMIAEGSAVVAGGFVFAGTNPELQVVGASCATSSATADEGLAVMERYQLNRNGFASSMVVNEGEEIAVIKKGYCYVSVTATATRGEKVFVNTTTGAIATGSSAGSGEIDTGWVVVTGASAGEVAEIACI